MQKCLIIGLALALSVAPFAARASGNLEGEPCTAAEHGMTQMNMNGTNIIACMKVSATNNTYVWKGMYGSGGDGIDCTTVGNIFYCINKASGKVCQFPGFAATGNWVCYTFGDYNIN